MQQVEKGLAAALEVATSTLASKRQVCRLECRLWVIKGVIEHGHNQKKLQAIVTKHEMLGLVPIGYYYPELYQK